MIMTLQEFLETNANKGIDTYDMKANWVGDHWSFNLIPKTGSRERTDFHVYDNAVEKMEEAEFSDIL